MRKSHFAFIHADRLYALNEVICQHGCFVLVVPSH